MASATGSLSSGPGHAVPLHIDSTETTLAKDQSSLTAINVNGLVRLDTSYALMMSVTAIAIFVFGLLLHRRGEFVALRALGMGSREVRALVIVEAAVVTLCGLAAGLLVGTVTARLSIGVLRGLFVLDPRIYASGRPFRCDRLGRPRGGGGVAASSRRSSYAASTRQRSCVRSDR